MLRLSSREQSARLVSKRAVLADVSRTRISSKKSFPAVLPWQKRTNDFCREEQSMDQYRSRLKLSESIWTNHWSIPFLGKFVWTNGPESSSKVPPTLVYWSMDGSFQFDIPAPKKDGTRVVRGLLGKAPPPDPTLESASPSPPQVSI